MKKTYGKNIFREVRSSLGRFFAIFAITALGAGFFTGLKTTAPDMTDTAAKYYRDSHLADYRLLSTMGFTEADIQALRAQDDLDAVMPTYSMDLLVDAPADTEGSAALGTLPARLITLPGDTSEDNPDYLNRPVLLEGRFPAAADECLADSAPGHTVGDVITLSAANDADTLKLLTIRKLTVVGTAESSSYVSFQRGNTNIGSGKIEEFIYVTPGAVDSDYYTEVMAAGAGLAELYAFSDEYKDAVEAGAASLKKFGDIRSKIRHGELYAEGEEKLSNAEKDLSKGKKKLEDGRRELEAGKRTLADANIELNNAKSQLADGERALADARVATAAALESTLAKIREGEKCLAEGQRQLEENRQALADAQSSLNKGHKELNVSRARLKKEQATCDKGKASYDKNLADYNTALAAYNQGRAEYDAGVAGLEGLQNGKAGLEELAASLDGLAAQIVDPLTPTEAMPQLTASFGKQAATAAGILTQLAGQLSASGMANEASALSAAAQSVTEATIAGQYALVGPIVSVAATGLQTSTDSIATSLAAALAELQAAQPGLVTWKAGLDSAAKELSGGAAALEKGWAAFEAGELEWLAAKDEYEAGLARLEAAAQALGDAQKELSNGTAAYNDGVAAAEAEFAYAEQNLADARVQIADGERKVADGEADISKNEQTLRGREKEAADGEKEIKDGRKVLDELDPPTWYVTDRNSNPGYSGFESDCKRIDSIALVFPIFFFLVAALVCLTTMTRMVEDQRTQIGTLKALGFSRGAIAMKYILYACIASFSGALIGVAVGSLVFPEAIWQAYGTVYLMPALSIQLHPLYASLSAIVSVLCTTLATLAACLSELRSVPATLMRPRAPQPGKRIVLERIASLWWKMTFSQKVTARNLLRYKRRFFMTVIGVAGCSALLLTGFGLRDSVVGIVGVQFDGITLYDVQVSLTKTASAGAGAETALNGLLDELGEGVYLEEDYIEARKGGRTNAGMTTCLRVPERPGEISRFIDMHQRESGDAIAFPPAEGAVITEKLASKLWVSVGDTIEVARTDEPYREVRVAGIMENYIFNYVYLAPATYEAAFGKPPEYNTLLLRYGENPALSEADALASIVDTEEVAGAINITQFSGQISDILQSLNAVIWVVILAAAALAFVVLYNLTNINITERTREIATLKVLGFYNNEVRAYVFRENIILTLIGALIGLVLGVFLHQFVITAAEVDEVMFLRVVAPLSYLLAVAFTLLTAGVVNLVMTRQLRGVDMVESLKSTE